MAAGGAPRGATVEGGVFFLPLVSGSPVLVPHLVSALSPARCAGLVWDFRSSGGQRPKLCQHGLDLQESSAFPAVYLAAIAEWRA